MPVKLNGLAISALMTALLATAPAAADPLLFSTGNPDGLIATATRPSTGSAFEIESADDFALTGTTSITSATFTGLAPSGSTPEDVVVEIYRVFPSLSDVGRTSGPPTFSTPQVPTRVNSPSDVELDDRDSAAGSLTLSTKELAASFTASNSIQPGGIHPLPNVFTGGNGPVRGEEVEFDVSFKTPFVLPAGHYFFVPQVELDSGNFLWLSAPKPIVPPGTSFPPGVTDLQTWTRDAALEPDWLRVGTDITHQGPFNAAFSLSGSPVPEPSTWAMMLFGFAGVGYVALRRKGDASALV